MKKFVDSYDFAVSCSQPFCSSKIHCDTVWSFEVLHSELAPLCHRIIKSPSHQGWPGETTFAKPSEARLILYICQYVLESLLVMKIASVPSHIILTTRTMWMCPGLPRNTDIFMALPDPLCKQPLKEIIRWTQILIYGSCSGQQMDIYHQSNEQLEQMRNLWTPTTAFFYQDPDQDSVIHFDSE